MPGPGFTRPDLCSMRTAAGQEEPARAGLGIAAILTANMAQGWSHGPVGAVVAAWPAVSLVGSYELLGLADPRVRGGRTRAAGRTPLQSRGMPCCDSSPPGLGR